MNKGSARGREGKYEQGISQREGGQECKKKEKFSKFF
jgi:hypothetical protein